MIDDRELAIVDVLFAVTIICGFGTTLIVNTLPMGAMLFSAIAFVFGVVWLAYAASRLRTRRE